MAGSQELSLGRGMALVAPGFILALVGALCCAVSQVLCGVMSCGMSECVVCYTMTSQVGMPFY